MQDGTRLIFWIDIAVLLIVTGLALSGKWDYVIAVFVALVVLNYFDGWWNRHRPSG